jgi:hypothetical protein
MLHTVQFMIHDDSVDENDEYDLHDKPALSLSYF